MQCASWQWHASLSERKRSCKAAHVVLMENWCTDPTCTKQSWFEVDHVCIDRDALAPATGSGPEVIRPLEGQSLHMLSEC